MGIDYQKIVLVNFGMIYLTLVKLIIFVTFCVQHQRAYPSAGWAAAAKSKSRRAAARPTPLSWEIAKKTSSQTCSGKTEPRDTQRRRNMSWTRHSIRELGINPIERLVQRLWEYRACAGSHSYGGLCQADWAPILWAGSISSCKTWCRGMTGWSPYCCCYST